MYYTQNFERQAGISDVMGAPGRLQSIWPILLLPLEPIQTEVWEETLPTTLTFLDNFLR